MRLWIAADKGKTKDEKHRLADRRCGAGGAIHLTTQIVDDFPKAFWRVLNSKRVVVRPLSNPRAGCG